MAGILMQGRLTISDEIYNRILMKIIEGQWQVGDKLPSEKQLCELFGASRVSVRTALSRLAARGIIFTRQGKGSFIQSAGAVTRTGGEPQAGADLREAVLQFTVFRQCIESKAVELFLQRAGQQDLQQLQELVDRMGEASDLEQVLEQDLAFHEKIIATGGNRYLIRCWETFRGDYAWNFRNSYQKNHYDAQELQRQHQYILDCLREQDGKAAMSMILRGFIR